MWGEERFSGEAKEDASGLRTHVPPHIVTTTISGKLGVLLGIYQCLKVAVIQRLHSSLNWFLIKHWSKRYSDKQLIYVAGTLGCCLSKFTTLSTLLLVLGSAGFAMQLHLRTLLGLSVRQSQYPAPAQSEDRSNHPPHSILPDS